MSVKYSSLEELKRKKELLKQELSDIESLLKFDNAKESLSVITNGASDTFLKNEYDEEGHAKTALRKDVIVKKISGTVKDSIVSRDAMMGIANTALKGGVVDDMLQLGAVALIGNFAKKNIKSSKWQNKALGFAMIYLAPIALRYAREQLEQYQKNKSVSSFEKLI